jgi:glutamine amidotransferase
MCRLYGFRASEPTKVECTLVYAQNALMVQSREDLSGRSNASGWGLAVYENGRLHVERQAWAAYRGEHFQRAAARIFSCQVLAHVRRATVGEPKPENTHPFVDGPWAFIHNGTIPNFDFVRPKLLGEMPEERRAAIRGETDSEHVFHYLRALQERFPDRAPLDLLEEGLAQIVAWVREAGPTAKIGLNVILTDGREMVGSRIGRPLQFVERRGVHDCEICGFPHVHHDPCRNYRALIVASEPISHEDWREVPDSSVYRVSPDYELEARPLELAMSPTTSPRAATPLG